MLNFVTGGILGNDNTDLKVNVDFEKAKLEKIKNELIESEGIVLKKKRKRPKIKYIPFKEENYVFEKPPSLFTNDKIIALNARINEKEIPLIKEIVNTPDNSFDELYDEDENKNDNNINFNLINQYINNCKKCDN